MKKVIYAVLATMPAFAFAAPDTTGLTSIVTFVGNTVKSLVPIVFGLAIIYFFWGLATYIRAAGDPKKAAEGKSIMIYGVIAIAVMISIYGLVAWLQNVLGITAGSSITVPTYS